MKHRLLKSQKGAVVVEAAIIMPIVIAVILILLYMAFFEVQKGIMYSKAQRLSQDVCNMINYPGYKNILNKETLTSGDLTDTFKTHDPYRYLFGTNEKNFDIYQKDIEEDVKKVTFLNGDIKATITPDFKNLSKLIQVDITYNYRMPAFVELVGVDRDFSITTTAVTYANDTVEYIRNTDMAFDLLNYLLEKLGIKGKVQVFYEKVMTTIGKFK